MNAAPVPEMVPLPPPRRRGRPPGSRNRDARATVKAWEGAASTLPLPTGIGWRLEFDEVIRLRCRAMEHGMPLGDYLAGVLRDSLRGPSRVPGSPQPLLLDPTGELCPEGVAVLEGWRTVLLIAQRERKAPPLSVALTMSPTVSPPGQTLSANREKAASINHTAEAFAEEAVMVEIHAAPPPSDEADGEQVPGTDSGRGGIGFRGAVYPKETKKQTAVNMPKIQILRHLAQHTEILMMSGDPALAKAAADEHAAAAEKLAAALRDADGDWNSMR